MRLKFSQLAMFFSCAIAALSLTGCGGNGSALRPIGMDAVRMASLFWFMAIMLIVILASVVALTLHAVRVRGGMARRKEAQRLVLGTALVPAVALAALLVYSVDILAKVTSAAPDWGTEIHVYGEQWWWRVRYDTETQKSFETANEIWLPAGRRVNLFLHSHNVIHSFWAPALGGKMDMIPGRVNRLTLDAALPGVYRGVCAEYCGKAHAMMAFYIVVKSKPEFDDWMRRQLEGATIPESSNVP